MLGCSTAAVSHPHFDRRPLRPSHQLTGSGMRLSIAELAESLAALLRRPVAIATLAGELLACCDPDADSGPGSNGAAHSFWHPALRQLNASRSGSDQGLLKTVRVLSEEREGTSTTQIVCPIRANDALVASVFVLEGAARLSAICVRHAEHTALAASLYFEQLQKCLHLEKLLGTLVLNELLNGRFQVDPAHTALAASINLSIDRPYRVAVLSDHPSCSTLADDASRTPSMEQLLTILAQNDAPRAVLPITDGIAFLLPAETDLPRFWNALRRATLSLVVGAPVQGAETFVSSYVELQALRAEAAPGMLQMQGRVLLPSVLRGDRGAQQAFVESIFGKLAKLRGGKSLTRSLATFARVGFHQARAAKALYIHPNTLRYRIDRISQALGLDLMDADVRFRVQLASHLWMLNTDQGVAVEGPVRRRKSA